MSAIKANRGFLQFLLSNPLLLLSAALGIALVFTGMGLKFYKSRADHWQAQHAAEKAAFAGYRQEQTRIAEEAGRAARAKEAKQTTDNQRVIQVYERQVASLRSDLKRLRDNPVRPDGSAVPVTSCGPASADGAPGQSVPIEEYRALELRAAEDALKVMAWQDWAVTHGLASRKPN